MRRVLPDSLRMYRSVYNSCLRRQSKQAQPIRIDAKITRNNKISNAAKSLSGLRTSEKVPQITNPSIAAK